MAKEAQRRMEIKLILPDTNVLIYALAGREPYASFLRDCIKDKTLILSSVVVAEFLCGADDEEEKIFNGLLQNFPVLPVDLPIAQLAAYYRKKYLKSKQGLKLPDCLIAATCKVHRATFVTLNKKDYPIEGIEIIDEL